MCWKLYKVLKNGITIVLYLSFVIGIRVCQEIFFFLIIKIKSNLHFRTTNKILTCFQMSKKFMCYSTGIHCVYNNKIISTSPAPKISGSTILLFYNYLKTNVCSSHWWCTVICLSYQVLSPIPFHILTNMSNIVNKWFPFMSNVT